MKVLITGSGGFVGQNLKLGLSTKYQLLSPRSKELDLTDERAVRTYIKKNGVTHVVHAAVHSGIMLTRDVGFQCDLRMLVNLTRNLDIIEKLIVFGSGAEFDKTRDIHKVREEDWGESIPKDLYGLAKFLTTEIVRREPKMVNLRLFGIYGPYEDYRYKFISNTIAKTLMGLPIVIKQDVVFDYLYVTDLIPVVKHFLTHTGKHHDYNVTTIESIRISELAKMIADLGNRPHKVIIQNRGLNYEYTANNERLRRELPDWKITSYEEGIQSLFEYYRENIKLINKEELLEDVYFKQSKIK